MKVQPQDQFKPTPEIVALLGDYYSITVNSYIEATAGIENTTLIVTAAGSKNDTQSSTYVFRVYRQGKKTAAEIRAEIDFMAYLGDNGIPVPAVVPNISGQPVTIFEAASRTWQSLAMEFIAGEHPSTLPDALLKIMATTQARMHQLADNYTGRLSAVRTLTELTADGLIRQIGNASADSELRAFLERGAAHHVTLSQELPAGPCHLDYNKGNVLCQGNKLTAVLDFDDMAIAPYAVCLANSLWHAQDTYGATTAEAYLQAYEHTRPLSSRERQLLPSAMLSCHYTLSAIRMLGGKTSPDHVKDYVCVETSLLARL